MRLFMVYVDKNGEKLPVGTAASDSCECLLKSLPPLQDGIHYLVPEEILDPERILYASREYRALAEQSLDEERRREAERAADELFSLARELERAA